MTIYNTIIKILRKNASSLIIGLIITVGVSFLMSGDLNRQINEVDLAKVAILGPQQSEAAKDFVSFMKDQQEIVTLSDISEKGLDDALYFSNVDYILWLPSDFEEQLTKGGDLQLNVQTRPGTYNKALVDTSVNQFINTYQDLSKADPANAQYNGKALMTILQTKGKVHHDAGYQSKMRRETTTIFYNILAYGMFMVIFNGYGPSIWYSIARRSNSETN